MATSSDSVLPPLELPEGAPAVPPVSTAARKARAASTTTSRPRRPERPAAEDAACPMRAARWLLGQKGLSPRGGATEYFCPSAVQTGVTARLRAVAASPGAVRNPLVLLLDEDDAPTRRQASRATSGITVRVPQPPSSCGSPSVARSHAAPDAAASAVPAGALPAAEIAAAGWTPFRAIRLMRNGDELVLCVTELRDRVCVYYPRERAAGLRAAGAMFPGIPVDEMKEEMVANIAEAEEDGVDMLAEAAVACAEENKAAHDGLVFGAIAAAVSSLDEDEEEIARYFALLHREDEAPLFFFAHGCPGAAYTPARFARSVGTAPIVHSDHVSDLKAAAAAALHVRRYTEASELRQAADSVAATAATLKETSAAALAALAALGDTLHRSLRMRARETDRLLGDVLQPETDADDSPLVVVAEGLKRHVRRLGEFGSYTSRLEEVIGTAASSAVAAAADMETAIRSAAAEAFVETQAVFANATFKKRLASEWGIDATPADNEALAAVNYTSITKALRVPSALCDGRASTSALRRVAVAAEHAVDIRRVGNV